MKSVRLIIHHDRVEGEIIWIADTDKQLELALADLFVHLDDQGCFDECSLNPIHQFVYQAAKGGDPKYVRQMLGEYEGKNYGWRVIMGIDPA